MTAASLQRPGRVLVKRRRRLGDPGALGGPEAEPCVDGPQARSAQLRLPCGLEWDSAASQ